jgi:hypothetical protein
VEPHAEAPTFGHLNGKYASSQVSGGVVAFAGVGATSPPQAAKPTTRASRSDEYFIVGFISGSMKWFL